MSNIVQKFRYLLATKRLIKQAIIDMGVDNVSDVFRSYPDKIREIRQLRAELFQLTTFPVEIQNGVLDIGFLENNIDVREDVVLITSVNPEDIYELEGAELDSHDDGNEAGSGDGGFVP